MPTLEAPTPVIISDSSSKTAKAMHWKVILLNCSCHSFADVEEALVKIIHCSKEKAKEYAMQVHKTGKAVVFNGHKERAEAKYFHIKQEQLEAELTQ
jgi:ATP-dependent Clp protease adapter protein ClpS